MSTQPEALRLADALENGDEYGSFGQTIYGWIIENGFGPVDAYDPTHAAANELRRLHAENAELIQELRNIASADWRKWDEEMRTPDEFVYWAKSRARFAIAKAEGG